MGWIYEFEQIPYPQNPDIKGAVMNLYKAFKADGNMEKDGIDLPYGEGVSIRIARAGGSNSRYGKLLGERLKPHRRQMDNGTLDDKVAERIMAEVYADAVLVGWQGVTDADGAPLEFSRDNCIRLLLDLPELFRDIQEQAGRVANFRKAELEADAKN
ncbi:MAG: hypothetical protein RBR06_06065 [Desulfuromonadaceae bacterium]|nr:hypothetical protein [Desulfuromonadaceae bacterium]